MATRGRGSLNRAAALAAVAVICALGGRARAGDLEDGEAAFQRSDYATALSLLRPLADQGDAAAEYRVGTMYLAGQGVAQDAAAGAAWNQEAAAQGYAPAKTMRLVICLGPQGGAIDDCQAVVADIRSAAEAGDPQAQLQLGSLYLRGNDLVAKDPATAVDWVRKAADQGFAKAQFIMGLLSSAGVPGAPADPTQSLEWYRKAADQGDVAAIEVLGTIYRTGLGVEKDPARAVSLFRQAAEHDDLMASWHLAEMYDQGEGVAKDETEALYWYAKLAKAGDADAAAKLGSAYALGHGVPQDYLQAYVWMQMAVLEGDERSGLDYRTLARDGVAGHLSPAQIAEAERTAAEMKAKADAEQQRESVGLEPLAILLSGGAGR